MSTLDIDSLHSVEISGDRLLVRLLKGNSRYDLTVDQLTASLLIPQLIEAAKRLPAKTEERLVYSMGFVPIQSDTGELGIVIRLSEQLSIPLLLGHEGLRALRDCIDQVVSDNQPPRHKH